MLCIFCYSKNKKKENIRVNLNDFLFGSGFLGMTPRAQPTKEKIDKLDLNQN